MYLTIGSPIELGPFLLFQYASCSCRQQAAFMAGRRGGKQPSASVLISKRKSDFRHSEKTLTHLTASHEDPHCKGAWEVMY